MVPPSTPIARPSCGADGLHFILRKSANWPDRWLAKARALRGSWLDPFRFTPDKVLDRQLLADYEADLAAIVEAASTSDAVRQLAEWPSEIRGFGPVRTHAAEQAKKVRDRIRSALMA